MLYVNPDFHKALAQYALSQSSFRNKIKTHDIVISALEDWARSHGIDVPVRAKEQQTTVPKKKRAG